MNARKALWPLALGLVMLLAGCPPAESPISLDDGVTRPVVRPAATAPPGVDRTPQANPGEFYPLGGARLYVEARTAGGGAPLPGAEISAIGPGLGFGTASATGDLTLGPLPLGTYELRVEADGRVVFARTVQLTVPRSRVEVKAELAQAARTVVGHVTDSSGVAVQHARVALGKAWTYTDGAGDYSLATADAGDVTIVKTGFQPLASAGGDAALTRAAPRVSFENDPFGSPSQTAFATLRGAIGAMGWTVADRDATSQIRIWAAPNAVSDAQAKDAAAFVAAGGKLLVLADWGGASAYSPEAAKRLLVPLGLQVNADLVRVPGSLLGRPEWFNPAVAAATPAAIGNPTVALLGACSILAAPPGARILTAPSDGYRVQAAGSSGLAVAAVRQISTGLAMVIGDTSAWLDPDIGRQDNLSFIRNVLAW
ncbi:MAG: carboxypeptidase regulatory-like domain-containing protein [Candidatus Sericytochromatia bacterium]|nr:carboxypeptidase regulatory-like domain-containing protein [Candidatus Tanganyikabacteria bacterium]